MNFLALFFICVRMFHFIHAQRIYMFFQAFSHIIEEKRKHPDKRQVIMIDATGSMYVLYFVSNILYLLYCIWLMLQDATWTPGFLLLIIAAMESTAINARISGTYEVDENGFVLPRTWFRYLIFGETMFILLKLFEG